MPVTIDSTQYYRYTDDTGNEQYFYYDTSKKVYVDEDGQNRTFALDTTSIPARYKITDKSDNVLTFEYVDPDAVANSGDEYGRLVKISNAIGDYISIAHSGTTQKITTITDGANRVYNLNYTSGYLSSIAALGSRTISYGYDSAWNLTSITYPDSTTSQPMKSYYTYVSKANYTDNGLLSTMKGIDKHELDFTYTSKATSGATAKVVPQVTTMVEKGVDPQTQTQQLGGSRSFAYDLAETTVTDQLNNVNIYQFNQYGNAVSIKDNFGRAVYCQYYTPTAGTADGGTYGQNKMSLSSKLQEPIMNYALNSSFEDATNWTSNLSNAGGSVARVTSQSLYGDYSVSVDTDSEAGYNSYYQDVAIIPGKTYTVSTWLKTSAITTTTGGGAILQGRYADSAGTNHYVTSTMITGTNNWQRINITFTVPSDSTSSSMRILLENYHCIGTAYYDGVQVELQPVVNRYNLVQNGDMSISTSGTPNYWTKSAGCTTSDTATTTSDPGRGLLDNDVFKIVGGPVIVKELSQTINVSGLANDTFSFGAWGKANSVPFGTKMPNGTTYGRRFCIRVELFKTGGASVKATSASFNTFSSQWQYVSGRIVATDSFDYAVVTLQYDYNANTAYFDGIQLYEEEFGQCYNYDKDGNLITVKSAGNTANSSSEGTNTVTYDANDNPTTLQPPDCSDTDKYTTTYLSGTQKHLVNTTTTVEGVATKYFYDSYGNTTISETRDDAWNPTIFIRSKAEYTVDGNYITKSYDPRGYYSTYNYDTSYGVNKSTTDPSGQTVSYTLITTIAPSKWAS